MVGPDGRFDLNIMALKLVPPSPNRGEWGVQLIGAACTQKIIRHARPSVSYLAISLTLIRVGRNFVQNLET